MRQSPAIVSARPFPIHEPKLRDLVRQNYELELTERTKEFDPAQQYLTKRYASAVLAEWTWGADMSPNQEAKYSHPITTQKVVELIVEKAAMFARNRFGTESDMNQVATSSEFRARVRETFNNVKELIYLLGSGQ